MDWSQSTSIIRFKRAKNLCRERYMSLPFRNFCNFDYEYPCYRASVPEPLDIFTYRPCINITQIGDGMVDCYGDLDEKNTLEDCEGNMFGDTLRCREGCVSYNRRCSANSSCSTSLLCSYRSKNSSWCSGVHDVVCLNGSCAKNARCDGRYQCLYGEDEHWCLMLPLYRGNLAYRGSKRLAEYYNIHQINIPYFPKITIQYTRKRRNVISDEQVQSKRTKTLSSEGDGQQIHPEFSYVCNQGFPFYIPSDNTTRCACPSTFYGSVCQYFSDRISIITQVDLTTFPTSIQTNLLTVVVYLYFENIVIDHHIFHVNPSLESKDPIRHRFYLLYSRSNDFLKHKRLRYFNRTDILNYQPYSVHFDIYSLTNNQITELGSFHYPIYFDFLPVFRLATVLTFPSWFNNDILDSCASNPCNPNSTCKPILNQNHSYYCSCISGYSGINCENYHSECLSYCNSKSICPSKVRGLISNSNSPLCICPLGHFGPRCYLKNEACKSNPCGQNATCYASNDPSGEDSFICICSGQFYGNRCQYETMMTQIRINNMTISATASSSQHYYLIELSNILNLFHQQVTRGVPEMIQNSYPKIFILYIVILKIYQNLLDPKYYILHTQLSHQSINFTTTPEECPYASNLLFENDTNHIPQVFKYHQLCKHDPNRICFHDDNYFCLCDANRRAECFGFDTKINQCNECHSNGRCIGNDLSQSNNFICICPRCTQGSRCEISLQALGFTFDSLLAFDTKVVQYIYISMTMIIFLFGLFNNYCSFVTFIRNSPRVVAVGNYLLFVTILNQCSLFILLLKFISTVLGSMGITSTIACKIISYTLSVSTRSTYWLTSWITINRLLTILYPTSLQVRSPRSAKYSSLGTFVTLLIMHMHEIFFHETVQEPNSSISICVTNFHYPIVEIYNRISTFIHYLLPFCIQIISIVLLLIRTARRRAKAIGDRRKFLQIFKQQISTQKELFVIPIIIIFSALPQTILSFSLACSQLSSWKRHLLLITILLSYIPQILGFILFVLPSSTYKKEFRKTSIAKKRFKWMFTTVVKKDNKKPITK